ncbi:hypothetical protein ARAM_002411 [Aspergillus rambellii]|uniref:Zn(2)-C6 fungal-type domain-containing protein n=3 Tax=Aspergillus subgen. Nidulantes TaxID=2720870 RepID=A0A0F8TXL4_9EURO|nr:hypothetical protein ARAM_002411 [Aspergillus rambellii]KKK15795.1 hypothetical protein AOCH_001680 [Aspergillus ochraceoroseus]
MEAESPDSDNRESLVRRACDQCRLRKIRCDKRSPCSNCRTSKVICRSTGAGQKPREPRKRVLISNEYEKKIDMIEERLSSIEEVLCELKTTLVSNKGAQACPQATPVSRQISPPAAGYGPNATAVMDQQESKHAFEGSSLLATQSAYASSFLETAVSRNALQMSASKINAALSTLKQIVNMQDNQTTFSRETSFANQQGHLRSYLRDLTMPPVEVVLPLLRKAKETYPNALQTFCPFITMDRLVEKCREIYFAAEDYSDATFIVANGGLYQLFIAVIFIAKDKKIQEEYQTYVDQCRVNLEVALTNLHLLMPASAESIEGLAMGAIHAIEISKPSFAFTLTSTASRLCQTLGYHQESSMEHDSKEAKAAKLSLFWSIYCLDRALSMRLGRGPTIPDYDIDIPSKFPIAGLSEPWSTTYAIWIQLARIQGKVYQRLYSPAALHQPESHRVAEAHKLAADMQYRVMKPFHQMNPIMEGLSTLENLYMKSDEVSRYSILTLIYRAIPPQEGSQGTFIDECVETARAALRAHESCMPLLKEASESMKVSYLHWSILYAPFVPFIVLFCHIIEVSSWADLDRLDEFVTSLEPNCSLSAAIMNLHRLCHVLSNVARLYVEAKAQAQTQENQALASVGHEFDTYLSALGLAPAMPDDSDTRWPAPVHGNGPVSGEMKYGPESQNMHPHMSHITQLGNWFSGNQYMMGLLEEDLSLFDHTNMTQQA